MGDRRAVVIGAGITGILSARELLLSGWDVVVLDAAHEVFMERPFAQVTVEQIAQRAELSVGTLYNLFNSKEQIYKNVISGSSNQDIIFSSSCRLQKSPKIIKISRRREKITNQMIVAFSTHQYIISTST